MSSIRLFLCCLAALLAVAVDARAVDPSGTWTWTQPAPGAAAFASPREATLELELRDGVLSGSLSEVDGESITIDDARMSQDELSFTATGSLHGTVSYRGRLDGDTIRGTMVIPGLAGGEERTVDWVAMRRS